MHAALGPGSRAPRIGRLDAEQLLRRLYESVRGIG